MRKKRRRGTRAEKPVPFGRERADPQGGLRQIRGNFVRVRQRGEHEGEVFRRRRDRVDFRENVQGVNGGGGIGIRNGRIQFCAETPQRGQEERDEIAPPELPVDEPGVGAVIGGRFLTVAARMAVTVIIRVGDGFVDFQKLPGPVDQLARGVLFGG